MDKFSKDKRSQIMSSVKNRNTKPEMFLRRALWKNDIKNYRVHPKIFGSPDIYFPKLRVAIFVDGCFWHGCQKCYSPPSTNKKFWSKKIKINTSRDKEVNRELKKIGVCVLRVWEHDIMIKKELQIQVNNIKILLKNSNN